MPELHENLANVDEETFFSATDVATGNRINQVAVLRLRNNPDWIIAFFQPQDIFLSVVQQQSVISAVLVIIISVIVAGVAVFISQVFSRPITHLTEVAQMVASGDLTARAPVESEDELGILASTFNSMTKQMNELVSNLEDQVSERTKDLEIRATQLQAASEIARDATSESELETMLDRAVNLTRSRFSLNFVGIHLIGARKENIYLRAGTSAKGNEQITNTRSNPIGGQSFISKVATSAEPLNITGEAIDEIPRGEIRFADSRSWLALALRVGQETLGVMEFQSIQENAFGENEITLLQTLADQLANAIQKTELRQEVERALQEVESAYGQFTQTGWNEYSLGKERISGYSFDQRETRRVNMQSEEAARAWLQDEVIISRKEDDGSSGLAVPMKVRGETIGVLNLEFDKDEVPQESEELIIEVANRLGLVFENARLLDTTRERVERERLLADVSGRFRENLNVDDILKSAVEEIGKKFNINEVEIRLGMGSGSGSIAHELNEPQVLSTENDKS
ncbi:MAG: GAF domain-containing protein [Chloroflexota bacterium]